MEQVKMELKDNEMIIEGEFDIELDLCGMHVGYPEEDKDIFNKTAFEIRSYGEINLHYIRDFIEWINRRNVINSSKSPSEWPKWKIIFERLD